MVGRIVLIVLAAGLLCVAYGVFVERRWFRIRRYRLDILPADGPAELSVLHLSDLHWVRGDERKRGFLAGLPKADLCVVTGDFLGEPGAVEESAAALRAVRGRLASYYVLGSNDYFVSRPFSYLRYFRRHRKPRRAPRNRAPELIALLEADGWEHLRNVRREVALDGLVVELAGLDDAHIGWHDLRVAVRSAPGRFGFVVLHSPDPAPELAALGWDLIVAGHTHDGQVRFPLVGALVTNSQMPRRLSGGLIRLGRSFLHISPGIGTSKFAPFRFLCRPEATLLELRPRPHEPAATASSKTRS